MTRLSQSKLVQRVGDNVVIVDERSGQEVELVPEEMVRLLPAFATLYTPADELLLEKAFLARDVGDAS